ncbi:MAG: hypothetical protein H6815_09025 [Phycisphaeraceae bacterium]|nr:hypothetical protein [Phycisphaerales bacterium]MCB9860581.1 hypothetical protein [Phycisphaeraceae bacterium]
MDGTQTTGQECEQSARTSCWRCGYSFAGLTSDVCPECGLATDTPQPSEIDDIFAKLPWESIGSLLCAAFLFLLLPHLGGNAARAPDYASTVKAWMWVIVPIALGMGFALGGWRHGGIFGRSIALASGGTILFIASVVVMMWSGGKL